MFYTPPMPSTPHILIVDADVDVCKALTHLFQYEGGWHTSCCCTVAQAKVLLAETPFTIVVTELSFEDGNGFDLLTYINYEYPDILTVVISAFENADVVSKVLRLGAEAYLAKPYNNETIRLLIKRAIEIAILKKRVVNLQSTVEDQYQFENIVGRSKPMQVVFDLVRRVAVSNVSVVITGASGTGKEMIARAIHYRSNRKDRPFIALECAAIPETLLEAELFGYMRGAFTDAKTNKRGLMMEASGGTLFLDDVAELPLSLQAKVLRAIQEGEIRPLGATKTIPIDVRIVSATNKDLGTMVKENKFREDLFYRLNVMNITLPTLSERREDIPLLVEHFMKKLAAKMDKKVTAITGGALKFLVDYNWPGNIRELQNTIERAVALSEGKSITEHNLPENVKRPLAVGDLAYIFDEQVSLKELEKRYILSALEKFGGNKARVSKHLGIDRKTLYNKLATFSNSGKIPQSEKFLLNK